MIDLEPAIAAHVLTNWHPKVTELPCVVATKEVDLLSKGKPTHARIDYIWDFATIPAFVPINDYLKHQQTYEEESLNEQSN